MKIKFTFFRTLMIALLASSALLVSCSDDDDVAPIVVGQEGFFVVNEGAFAGGNASLSFFSKENNEMLNDIFFNSNNRNLGDQAQSMTIIDGKGYILVQNSSKIEVIDIDDFSSIATIDDADGIISPRYMISVASGKAYVSDWGATGVNGTIKVLDLTTNEVVKTIDIGLGTNEMVLLNGKVYVTNQGGFNNQTFTFSKDNRVVVVDVASDAVEAEITVGDNPSAIEVDGEGDIWVAGPGNIVYNPDFSINFEESTPGFLAEINVADQTATIFPVSEKASGPGDLAISPDGSILYFNYLGAVQTLSTTQGGNSLSFTSFIRESFYGFGVDPSNGNFIGLKAPSFTGPGSAEIYNASGTLQNSYTVGIGPGEITFK